MFVYISCCTGWKKEERRREGESGMLERGIRVQKMAVKGVKEFGGL